MLVLALITVVMALFGPLLFKKQRPSPLPAGKQGGQSSYFAKGVVESEHEVLMGSQAAGVVSKVMVTEGDLVKQGQLLAAIDSAKITAQIKQAEALLVAARERLNERQAGSRQEDIAISENIMKSRKIVYEQARDEFERQQRLYQKDATTKVDRDRADEKMKVALEQLEEARQNEHKQKSGSRREEIAQARAEVANAEAVLAFQRVQREDHQIRAPRDGLIVAKLKEPGETVEVGTPVLRFVDPSTLRIRAELEESDIGKVRDGQAVEVTTDSYRDKVFAGKVFKVLPAVKKKSMKTFDPLASFDMNSQEIYIRLSDYGGLKSGMTVTVKFKND